jgi:hypothetical protein
MTLLDAKSYDPAKERRRNIVIVSTIVAVLIVGALVWVYRYWPEERVASKFFAALEKQDYDAAYGVWMHDPQWKQHTQKYTQYPFSDFYRDWGPGSEWGLIKSYKIYASGTPPGGSSSGVIVEVIVNGRSEHARVWVEKSDKTMSFSPY